ncbi:MAG: SRPBCC family protein [Gordonia sp. (in: high G+C Gram-positive bacteria)]
MGQITAATSIDIAANPDVVIGVLADYTEARPALVPEQYRDYRVISGGNGDGTVVAWILQATSKRQRNVEATVQVTSTTVTETDANSSMVTTYEVTPAAAGSTVTSTTTWNSAASGIGGFFEKTFAPKGLGRIQAALLANLKARVEK